MSNNPNSLLFESVLQTLGNRIGSDALDHCQSDLAETVMQQSLEISDNEAREIKQKISQFQKCSWAVEIELCYAEKLKKSHDHAPSRKTQCVLLMNGGEIGRSSVQSGTSLHKWNELFESEVSNPATDRLVIRLEEVAADSAFVANGSVPPANILATRRSFSRSDFRTGSIRTIGEVCIDLKNIPVLGKLWSCDIKKEKKNKLRQKITKTANKSRGILHVKTKWLSCRSRDIPAMFLMRDHYLLTAAVFRTQLACVDATQKYCHRWDSWQSWCWGLVDLHATHCNLSCQETALVRWRVAVEKRETLSLQCQLKTMQLLQSNLGDRVRMSREEMKYLLESTVTWVEFGLHCVENHHCPFSNDARMTRDQLNSLLRCMSLALNTCAQAIQCISEDTPDQFSWSLREKCDVILCYSQLNSCLPAAIRRSIDTWVDFHVTGDIMKQDITQICAEFASLESFLATLYDQLEWNIGEYDTVFKSITDINYAEIVIETTLHRVKSIVQPFVADTLILYEIVMKYPDREDNVRNQCLQLGTSVFSLFLLLKQFTSLERHLSHQQLSGSRMFVQIYNWFDGFFVQWLAAGRFKAIRAIGRATELPPSVVQDAVGVSINASADDTAVILHQMVTFWRQLQWPRRHLDLDITKQFVEDLYDAAEFYLKYVRCCVRDHKLVQSEFQFDRQLCHMINSAGHVSSQIHSIKLSLPEELLQEQSESSEKCSFPDSPDYQLRNIEIIFNQRDEKVRLLFITVIEDAVKRLMPPIEKILDYKQTTWRRGEISTFSQQVVAYLDSSALVMHSNLSRANMTHALSILLRSIQNSMQVSAKKHRKKHRKYFLCLSDLLTTIAEFIHGNGEGLAMDDIWTNELVNLRKWLQIYSTDVNDLITAYYRCRRRQVGESTDMLNIGRISLTVHIIDDCLRIEITSIDVAQSHQHSTGYKLKISIEPRGVLDSRKMLSLEKPRQNGRVHIGQQYELRLTKTDLASTSCFLVVTLKSKSRERQLVALGEAVMALSDVATEHRAQDATHHILAFTIPSDAHTLVAALKDKASSSRKAARFHRKLVKNYQEYSGERHFGCFQFR